MKIQNNPYQKHIFVCTNHRENGEVSCSKAGEEICEILKSYVKDKVLKGKVRVSRSGCFDLCAQGPNVMVFPEGIWYRKVLKEDLPQMIERHFQESPQALPLEKSKAHGWDNH